MATPAEAVPFQITGETMDDFAVELPECKQPTSVALRLVVRQLTGMPHVRSIPLKRVYFILGRLRCLQHTIDMYNRGAQTQSEVFRQYWQRRTLDLLSGFGFHVAAPSQEIVVVGLRELIAKIEELYAEEIAAAQDLIANQLISFDGLGELYRPETPVLGKTTLGGAPAVFMVVDSHYEERRALVGMEKSFHWTMEFVVSLGKHFSIVRFTEVMSGWVGVRPRPFSELMYTPLTNQDDVVVLTARGTKYAELGAGGARFLAYAPNSFFIHAPTKASMAHSGSSLLATGGRVMIDPERGAALGHYASQGADESTTAMMQQAGRYRRYINTLQTGGNSSGAEALVLWETVPTDLLIYCWPALVGFSFTAKAWGHVIVGGVKTIQFQEQAFDQLVLSEDRKQVIKALVRFGSDPSAAPDVIEGKCGGSIFLFHGPPGVGKTLTAEAIAEVLHRPLYYVTMGEMGMTPEDMEKRLGDVLDLCAGWNALTLLDEADVFLEQRTTSDLVRNAMVCVMLRLLEYHPGILFLTTNRVKKFDPAFESRVTVAMRYDSLTVGARIAVWKNLLGKVSVPVSKDITFEDLAQHPLNGRQIKNAVRLAVALSIDRETPVSQCILESTVAFANLGRQEMSTDESWQE